MNGESLCTLRSKVGEGGNCVSFNEDIGKIEVWVKYMSGLEDTAEVSERTC